MDFDLVVIGSGPAGQRGAIQAAKLGRSAVVIERMARVGGVSIHGGTIPSKTLREAAVQLRAHPGFHPVAGTTPAEDEGLRDLVSRAGTVIANESSIVEDQLRRNGVELIRGSASFLDRRRLLVTQPGGQSVVSGERILIATGSRATRDLHVHFDGETIITSDDMPQPRVPRALAIVGAGVIGCEFACMAAALGVYVTLIDRRERLLPAVDHDIADELKRQMRSASIDLRLGDDVARISRTAGWATITLASGAEFIADCALYAIGRTGATAGLNLAAAGVQVDARGRIRVNDRYQTRVPHIYAAGDVIGSPALAATSMEQGRVAVCHAFGVPAQTVPEQLPQAIYTIPELSSVGLTEEVVRERGYPYQVGLARYREIARGQIVGDDTGLLKLIFHAFTRELLGVHIIGTGASELVHIGQAVMQLGGGLDYLLSAVFNYPTLAECYKTAALDAANRLAARPSCPRGRARAGLKEESLV